MYAVGAHAANQDCTHETYNEASLEEGIRHGKNPCAQAALQQVDQCLGVPAGKGSSYPLSAILSSYSVHCFLHLILLSSSKCLFRLRPVLCRR
jgi:hypothetical protein